MRNMMCGMLLVFALIMGRAGVHFFQKTQH